MNCKYCGNDLDGRGDYGNREAVFCSDECRHGWHNMNAKIDRKEKALEKTLAELYDMLHQTEDNNQRSRIEGIAHKLNIAIGF